jgi:hypothetical protein
VINHASSTKNAIYMNHDRPSLVLSMLSLSFPRHSPMPCQDSWPAEQWSPHYGHILRFGQGCKGSKIAGLLTRSFCYAILPVFNATPAKHSGVDATHTQKLQEALDQLCLTTIHSLNTLSASSHGGTLLSPASCPCQRCTSLLSGGAVNDSTDINSSAMRGHYN